MYKYCFVTGKLAYPALKKIVEKLELEGGYRIKVLGSKVAALMNTEYISRHLENEEAEVVVIPGLCKGKTEVIEKRTGCRVVKGPEDLKDLPLFFGRKMVDEPESEPKIKILAEIVDASQLTVAEVVKRAKYYKNNGADIIDIGAEYSSSFSHLKNVIRTLKQEGFQVSIDSLQKEHIVAADEAGVDMVLSVNSSNIDIVKDLNSKLVVIPDEEDDLASLYKNVDKLECLGKEYVIDPILPPLTFGFVNAVSRYVEVRKRFPKSPMLMGVGNVTELTDADSTGINAVLIGMATELEIDYILTTECSARAKGAVREISIARKLMHRARENGILPKHLDYSLLTIKDPELNQYSKEELQEMQSMIRDKNFRIFVDENYIYVFNSKVFLCDTDGQRLFKSLNVEDPKHAFYLGRELTRAELALKLGKKYIQDRGLRWGYLNDY